MILAHAFHMTLFNSAYFYLESHDSFNSLQINRDLIAYDLSFAGDKPEEKGDDDNYERIHGQLKAWNILTHGKCVHFVAQCY